MMSNGPLDAGGPLLCTLLKLWENTNGKNLKVTKVDVNHFLDLPLLIQRIRMHGVAIKKTNNKKKCISYAEASLRTSIANCLQQQERKH